MRKASNYVVALGLALSGAAYADMGATQGAQVPVYGPVQMTDAEMDRVTAGAANIGLINVDVNRVLNNNNVDVRVPVDIRNVNVGVAAAVAVLGAAGAAVGQR